MPSYDRRTMFHFLFVICFLCKRLPGALSRSNTKLNSFGKRTRQCSWECRVSGPLDFLSEMKVHMSMNRRFVTELSLRQSVDNKCSNQTDYLHNSSKHADAWKCLVVNTLTDERNLYNPPVSSGRDSTGSNNPKSDGSSSRSVVEPIKGRLVCTFDPPTRQEHSPTIDLISNALIDKLEELSETWLCGGEIVQCCEEKEENSFYVCSTILLERLVCTLSGFTILIFVISILYFPVVLCLFSPTHVSHFQKLDLIVLDGPSHISIRGWVANFVSKVCWKLFRSRNPFLVLLLTVTAFCTLYLSPVFPIGEKDIIWMNIFCFLWGFEWVVRLNEQCVVCRVIGKETSHHASALVDVIKQHLRLQPLIIVNYWHLFRECVKNYLQTCVRNRRTTARQLVSLLVSLFKNLVSSLYLVFVSGPTSTILDFYANLFIIAYIDSWCLVLSRMAFISCFFVLYVGRVGFFLLKLEFALVNYLTIILKLENIPYLTLLVLSTFYCSKNYYSFTRKYDDLAAKLYGFLKKRVQQDDNQREFKLKYNEKKVIPKYLFDEACREVLPLAENICKLLLRISLILFLFYLVFISLTKTPSIPGRLKAGATFLIGLMPYIVEMVILKTGGEMKKLRQEELDEKIQSIVEEYCNNLPDESCPDQNSLSEESEQEERTIASPTISTLSLYYSALNIDEINE